MFERFTERARKVMVLAQEEARHFNHNSIDTEHLLLGLVREEEGVAARALGSLKITLEEVREQVESVVGYGGEGGTDERLLFTPRSKKALENALQEALALGHNYIGTEHLLLGLVGESEGAAAQVLSNLDVDSDKVRREVVRMLAQPGEALTPRGLEILELMASGKTNREIARDLHISVGNIKNQIESIIAKLSVSDRTQAVARAIELGLIPSDTRRATSGKTIDDWVGKRVSVAVENMGKGEPGRFQCTLEGADARGIVVSYQSNASKITRFYPWHAVPYINLAKSEDSDKPPRRAGF